MSTGAKQVCWRAQIRVPLFLFALAACFAVQTRGAPGAEPGSRLSPLFVAHPVQVAQADAAEVSFWESVEDTDDPAELQAYLVTYPSGHFASLAKLRLERLASPPLPAQTQVETSPPQVREDQNSAETSRVHLDHDPAFWNAIKAAKEPPGYRAHLETIPKASFALLAQRRLERLHALGASDAAKAKQPWAEPQMAALPSAEEDKPSFAVAEKSETYVTLKRSNVRASPTTDAAKIARLDRGKRVTVTGEVTDKPWLRIALADGREGYIYAPLIESEAEYEERQAETDRKRKEENERKAAEEKRKKEEQQAQLQAPPKPAATAQDEPKVWTCQDVIDRYPGSAVYAYQFALDMEKAGRLGEAVKCHRRAADLGETGAQHRFGALLYQGKGVRQDFAEAAKWFRKAAEHGLAASQYLLGLMYEDGKGVRKDVAEAAKWYRKSAVQGDAGSQFSLGLFYRRGIGVGQNAAKAVEWFRKSADQGFEGAQFHLGEMYEIGEGVRKDIAEAVNWYRKVAAQGKRGAKPARDALKRLGY